MTTKLYMVYRLYYYDDEDRIEIKGVWDNPQSIIDHFNSEWEKAFKSHIKYSLEYNYIIGDIGYLLKEKQTYIMSFNLNEWYDFDNNQLSYNHYMTMELEKKGAKRYSDVDEFFKEFGAEKFAPDPKVIEETNKQINEQIRLKEFTGPSLEEKMIKFKNLYRDLVKHGAIHLPAGGIAEIKKNGDVVKI